MFQFQPKKNYQEFKVHLISESNKQLIDFDVTFRLDNSRSLPITNCFFPHSFHLNVGLCTCLLAVIDMEKA